MKVLVVGTGSIGTRHIRNLAQLRHEVYAIDINKESLRKVSEFTSGTFSSLDKALEFKPDIAFICTFSNDHMQPALKCAEAGCHLFIEKPLSLSLDGIDELIEIIDKKNLITMVSCNMRFHPAISYINDTISNNPSFAKRLWANLEFGFYLPFDKVDYQNTYKAKKSLGGNLIFDGIHELDYAVWFLGEPEEVFCSKGIISSLEIDTEDCVDMTIKFKSGAVCTVHMDYLQHGYSRRCKIVCGEGTIAWDFVHGDIGVITASDKKWSWKDMKLDIYYNQMYLDEIKYFCGCVSGGKKTFNSVKQSLLVLRLAVAANKSCNTNIWEMV